MKKANKAMIGIALICLIAIIAWSGTYWSNSTAAKALHIKEERIIAEIPFAAGIAVIYREGDFLQAAQLEKGLLGWEKVTGSAPILAHLPESEVYSPNVFSWFYTKGQTLFWGYVPPDNEFTAANFSYGDHAYTTRANDFIWYLPLPTEVQGFEREQFTITLRSGEELPYPFAQDEALLSSE